MNFDLTDDQEALRDGIRAVCEGRLTMERVRGGFDRSMWDELAETGGCCDGGLLAQPEHSVLTGIAADVLIARDGQERARKIGAVRERSGEDCVV